MKYESPKHKYFLFNVSQSWLQLIYWSLQLTKVPVYIINIFFSEQTKIKIGNLQVSYGIANIISIYYSGGSKGGGGLNRPPPKIGSTIIIFLLIQFLSEW